MANTFKVVSKGYSQRKAWGGASTSFGNSFLAFSRAEKPACCNFRILVSMDEESSYKETNCSQLTYLELCDLHFIHLNNTSELSAAHMEHR